MITIIDKSKCCGCTACFSICPKHCIEMKMDEEGFSYPFVNGNICIECGLCGKVCPILNPIPKHEFDVRAFAFQSKDERIRKESSSGGAFTIIAEMIISDGGYVYGCGFDDDFNVIHDCAKNIKELSKFRGSKYVQSKLDNVFIEIKKKLDDKKIVLFSGTPCQVSGLKCYLRKQYDNLFLIDLVCHGIPSPGLWSMYIKYIKISVKSRLTYVSFRNKRYGYAGSTMALGYENGKTEFSSRRAQFYKYLFFQDINSRPSCFCCHFKGVKRVSDFTIYDCWHMNKIESSWDDDKGTTWVLVQSEKGMKLFERIKQNAKIKEAPVEMAIELDGQLALQSTIPNPLRTQFFIDAQQIEMNELIKKYFPLTLKKRITSVTKPLLYKLGLLDKLKRII